MNKQKGPPLDIIPFDDRAQQHPQHSTLPDWLPKHEFLMLIIAPAGSGKTTLLLNLILRVYINYWHRIFIFSPTIHNDAKWDHVRQAKNILMKPLKEGSYLKDSKNEKKTKDDDDTTNEEELPEWTQKEKSKHNLNERHVDPLANPPKKGKKGTSHMSHLSKRRGPALAPLRIKDREKPQRHQPAEIGDEEIKELLIAKLQRQKNYLKQMQPKLNTLQEQLLRDYKQEILHIPPMAQRPTTTLRLESDETSIRRDLSKNKPKNTKTLPRQILEQDMKDEYSEETLENMMQQQQKRSDELFKTSGDRSKYIQQLPMKMERLLWVFDDMVGSGLFNNKRNNAFKRLTVRRRHLYSSVIGVTQAYREIPKTTRTNANCLILFHIDNEEELATIYQEFPMGLKWPQWMKVVDYVTTRTPYSFITFNLQSSDPQRRIIMDLTQPLDNNMIQHILNTV